MIRQGEEFSGKNRFFFTLKTQVSLHQQQDMSREYTYFMEIHIPIPGESSNNGKLQVNRLDLSEPRESFAHTLRGEIQRYVNCHAASSKSYEIENHA